MRILMFHGRAGGHNILPFLEYFNNIKGHDLTFMYSTDRTYYPTKSIIRFCKFSLSPFSIIKTLGTINKKYDLIWYHGGHSAFILFIFSLFRSRQSKFIFNVWNEWLITKAYNSTIRSRMFRYGIRNADVIHCNWHGTEEILKATGWNNNIKVFYWGLHKDYFSRSIESEALETKNFLASLPKNKLKFFFPKSISPNSGHEIIIEAAKELITKGVNNFIIYMWLGNSNNSELTKKLNAKIIHNSLTDYVILKSHEFLSFNDMKIIWKQMDVGLQIAVNEQLSTTFLEPLFFQKEIIATRIRPYILFEKKFNLDLNLIPIDKIAIADIMEQIIKGNKTKKNVLRTRNKIVQNHFYFDKNIQKIIDYYSRINSV